MEDLVDLENLRVSIANLLTYISTGETDEAASEHFLPIQ